MIHPNLYRQPVVLDSATHRDLKIGTPMNSWQAAAQVHGIIIAAVEFADVCLDYPILFVDTGKDEQGQRHVAPIAAFGLSDKENLFVDGDHWRARYIPAMVRAYPFGITRVEAEKTLIMIDDAWPNWSRTEGTPLFNAQGDPSDELNAVRDQLQKIELEIQRTRFFGDALLDAGLLMDMRFEATLPNGEQITADGFMSVDDKKLMELPEAKVVELHRNGVLSLIHAHQISMRHMQKLVDWKSQRAQAAADTSQAPKT